jgi:CheY-like chemotaxis protein
MIAVNRPAGWDPACDGPVMPSPFEKGHDRAGGLEGEAYRLAGDSSGAVEPSPGPQLAQVAADHTPTVLVVEDHEPTRLAMASWLAREGFLVLTAANGHEAAGHLERPLEPIDVAVLDIGLPDVDGIAVCEKLRELYPTLPVIVCSGHAAPAEVARLMELGASRYFRKPVDTDELLAAVMSLLR